MEEFHSVSLAVAPCPDAGTLWPSQSQTTSGYHARPEAGSQA